MKRCLSSPVVAIAQSRLRRHTPEAIRKTLLSIRSYLSVEKDSKLDVILMCAFICISIDVMQNNWRNASIHLENTLRLLQAKSSSELLSRTKIDPNLFLTFCLLDLHASKFQGMRSPTMIVEKNPRMPGRFSSITQAKDALSSLVSRLWAFTRSKSEEYKYRKLKLIPADAVTKLDIIKGDFLAWKDRFDKFLNRSTSKFSRHEQQIIDILIIKHRTDYLEATTSIEPEAMAFDLYGDEFDEIVTLAAVIVRSQWQSDVLEFRLDMGIISHLYWTTLKYREPWTRKRTMSLLQSIRFQEGVWNATGQAAIARVAINREELFKDPTNPSQRPLEFARVHSVGFNLHDPVNKVAEINLTQKLNGLDGP